MDAATFTGRSLFALARCFGGLPFVFQRRIGDAGGAVAHALNTRETRVARRNLELIATHLGPDDREREVAEILRATGRNVLETMRVWTRPRSDTLRLVTRVIGGELLEAALAKGKGLIIAAPHYGNWELLIEFMAARGPFTLVYRVPKMRALDVFLRLARAGDNVHLVPAEPGAMRPLFKALEAGETIGITPDQQPKFGGGTFAPFFGKSALTLNLIPRLAKRSGAPVLFAYAESVPLGFEVRIEAAPDAVAGADLLAAVTAINARIETIARRDLRQYQWTYKRFTLRPAGSDEANPYHPDCY